MAIQKREEYLLLGFVCRKVKANPRKHEKKSSYRDRRKYTDLQQYK